MNQTTVALVFLLVVLIVAALTTRWVAVVASLAAFACYNYFFLPPVHTFAIAKGDDVVALLALLAVSLIGSHLSQQARTRASQALALARERDEAEIARQSAEMKSALVASLSHDLKTPLTALTLAAGNLALTGLTDEQRREQQHIVQIELQRLRRLFDHVVELASIEAHAMNPEPEWVLPAELIDAAYSQAGVTPEHHPIAMHGDVDRMLVHVDPRLTSAALAHVIENAAAYSPDGSPIEIQVTTAISGLTIAVRDHGPGLPVEDVNRVFERFYRGGGRREQPFGTGMGLAITRGLLALERGRIAASNHPDGGAQFTIDIPASIRAADTSGEDA